MTEGTAESTNGRLSLRNGRWRTVLAWTGVGAWGTWTLVRLAGGDRLPIIATPAAPALALTPYVAATVPIPILLAVLLRRWKAAIAAGVVAAGLVAVVLPRAIGGDQPSAHGPVVRILTANMLFGEADPNRIIQLVRSTNADILSLQEFTTGAVGRLEGAGLTSLLPYKVIDPRWGAAGSGLYSRYPMQQLPPLPRTQMAMPQAEVTLPSGRRLEVTAVHPVPPISAESLHDWKRDLGELPSARPPAEASAGNASGPVRILAGDFNATLDHATLRKLIGRGYADAADRAGEGLIPTWGLTEPRPPLTIDHVLVDRRCRVQKVEIHDLKGSDHRALFAEVRLP
ncbi:endonuclease/exonuclease/phosphatase family protein [Actinomadura barringtoniae]|uniref:Endonuclease/exonuclease/phosphatase family protein n=1 Tax=Actinomadura barringtoniae TaxID=1427535 RepID=A0A939P642_9ACTN|nr:endonuclease/exonuclease/phosphatase family protein [Actinomadura barringtoniae]MBO2445985.1 endonuclease/exonuclease/phosphatase family protein [Actinomadura barringtoniae]